jgi:hypothetical protein
MKKTFLFVLVLITRFALAQNTATQYAELITPADLKENLSIIASDAMEGRYTGSRGEKMAAAFISYQFDDLGLIGPVNGSHIQPIDLYSAKPGDVYVKTGTSRYANYNEIVYFGQADSGGEISLEVVYAGKGTDAEYAYLNVKDKAVVIYNETLGVSMFNSVRKTADLAREKGAKMVFVVSGGKPEDFKPFAGQLQGWLSGGQLSLKKPDPASPNKGMFLIDQSVVAKIFNTTLEKLVKATNDDASKKPLSKIKPSRLSYQVSMNAKVVKTENVLGYLEGTDKKDELVVISAHFDHIGKLEHGEGDLINNGADDDGSGTVTVLQLAKAFAKAKKDGHGPRRSILFITVTGEEEGLFGSEYYVSNPVFPLANTVVDLNIDMVGRRDPGHNGKPDYVYAVGADRLSSELHDLNERNNKTYTQLELDYTYNDEKHPERIYYRSDHWNFAKNNIPIIFYFDGVHEDYHKVSDEVGKIDFDLLAKRGKLVFYNAWELANRDNRIIVDKK